MARAEGALRERFARLLRTNRSFDYVLENGSWLCPYCGAVAAEDRKASAFESVAFGHLLTKCPRANGLQGPLMQPRQLEEIVRFLHLKSKYLSEPAWRLRVGEGAWLCPFCVQPTEVQALDGEGKRRPADDMVRDIRGHLTHCYAHWQNPEAPHSVEEIRASLQERKRRDAKVQMMAERMQSDPVFQFSDRKGRWICPFCETAVEMVDFSTPFARSHSAPRQAVSHLESSTCSYGGGELDPEKTLARMQELAEKFGEKKGAAEPAAPPDSDATRYLRSLRGELGELRAQLEQSKELQEDLERARKAQRRMLPPTPTDVPGYDLGVYFLACEKVSGDFYDFKVLEDGRVGILIGDVSGHGIDAGIVMGMAKKAFGLRAQSGADPATVAAKVNGDIFPELEKATFVTATYGVLDAREHVFRFVRCGHTFPVHHRAEAREAEEVRSEGMVLGSVEDPAFLQMTRVAEVSLGAGDFIVLFTDGLIEATEEEGEEFGVDRAKEAVLRHRGASARGVIEGLIGSIHIFTGGHPQQDDQTVLVIRRES